MARYLHQIAEDPEMTNAMKAQECLRAIGELSGAKEDLALVDFRVAAQAYATLSVGDAIEWARSQ